MTSLFELPEVSTLPPDLLRKNPRTISAIEFFTIDSDCLSGEDECMPEPMLSEPLEQQHARQQHAMLDAARAEARAEAISDLQANLEASLGVERERVSRVCREFAQDRQRYFAAAEAQVISLALVIARRVLAQEVRSDATHLEAIVRAALSRVREDTECVVRVNSSCVLAWTTLFSKAQQGSIKVVADDCVGFDECLVETEVGRVQLGINPQMDEIERGFGELIRRQAV